MSDSIRNKINADKELTTQLAKILEKHKCTKNYIFLDKSINEICPVCPLGNTEILECIDCNNNKCKYLYPVADKTFCECEVRIFIEKSFE